MQKQSNSRCLLGTQTGSSVRSILGYDSDHRFCFGLGLTMIVAVVGDCCCLGGDDLADVHFFFANPEVTVPRPWGVKTVETLE